MSKNRKRFKRQKAERKGRLDPGGTSGSQPPGRTVIDSYLNNILEIVELPVLWVFTKAILD